MGIEPTYPAWKAGVLPLNYTRKTIYYFLNTGRTFLCPNLKTLSAMPSYHSTKTSGSQEKFSLPEVSVPAICFKLRELKASPDNRTAKISRKNPPDNKKRTAAKTQQFQGKCPEPESNQRHEDFQSSALPTELSGPADIEISI